MTEISLNKYEEKDLDLNGSWDLDETKKIVPAFHWYEKESERGSDRGSDEINKNKTKKEEKIRLDLLCLTLVLRFLDINIYEQLLDTYSLVVCGSYLSEKNRQLVLKVWDKNSKHEINTFDGVIHRYRNNRLHCNDKPAIKGPTIEEWYYNGELHRTGGPAVQKTEYFGPSYEYWVHGKKHRTDGPAVQKSNNDQYWYYEGKLHRENGPAVIRPYIDVWSRELMIGEVGKKIWINGKLHEYWIHGRRHREGDEPAVCSKKYKEYWKNGKLHRDDGKLQSRNKTKTIVKPAIICTDIKKIGGYYTSNGMEDYREQFKNGYTEYWKEGKKTSW